MTKRLVVQKLFRFIVGAAALFGGASAYAQGGYLYFLYGTNKVFMQTGPFAQTYESGDFTALMRDGLYVIQPCLFNGGNSPFPPSLICPIGSTGFVAAGDLDFDGVRDDLSYFQVTNIVSNLAIAPFKPQLAGMTKVDVKSDLAPQVRSGPYRGFVDDSIMVFYNLLTADVFQYNQARYLMTLPYTNIGALDGAFPNGQYEFQFPTIQGSQAAFGGPISKFVEPFFPQSLGGLNQRFRFTNDPGRWDGEYMELDPRVNVTLTWQGTSLGELRQTDRLYFSVYDGDDELIAQFPPAGGRVRLPNPFATQTILPSNFFSVGDIGVGRLEFERGNRDTTTTQEVTNRTFKFKIRFIDGYEGFAAVTFPVGTSAALRAPSADYDADGFSNLIEFAYQSDVTGLNPFVKPTPVAGNPVTFKVDPIFVNGIRTVTITKRSGVGNSLTYGFEYSLDNGANYIRIKSGDYPGWQLVAPEDAGSLILRSTGNIPASAIFRPYVEQKPGY